MTRHYIYIGLPWIFFIFIMIYIILKDLQCLHNTCKYFDWLISNKFSFFITSNNDWYMIIVDFRVGDSQFIEWLFSTSNRIFIVSIFWGIYILTITNTSLPLNYDIWLKQVCLCETSISGGVLIPLCDSILFTKISWWVFPFALLNTIYFQILFSITFLSLKINIMIHFIWIVWPLIYISLIIHD